MLDRDEWIQAVVDMVRIPSINPTLVPGADGERALADWLVARLSQTPGIDVVTQDCGDGRLNVIASAGPGGGQTLLINGHIDTVGVAGMADPFTGRVRNERIYGRGAVDMKGALGPALVLLETVATDPEFVGRLIVAFVVDEEHSSIGTQKLVEELDRFAPDAAVIVEPSGLNGTIAHKGFVWATITTHGRAAHGSDYEAGIDAIAHMGRVIYALELHAQDLERRPPHGLCGPPSLHLSMIEGGQELSSYPDRCVLQLERRTIPGETEAHVREELEEILEGLAIADPAFHATLEITVHRSPWMIEQTEPIVQLLGSCFNAVTGLPLVLDGAAGWMDSALLGDAGVPTVIFGPSGEGAHAVEEWLDLEATDVYADCLTRLVYRFCGHTPQSR